MEFFATAGTIPVHINDTKKGEKTIVLLHGYLETLYIWNEFVNLLAKEYRVISIDLPGHGLSCSGPVNSMEFMATVVKEVLDVCGVEKAIVGGHSMGGYVAIACCRLFPESFEKLILFNSHPYPDPAEKAEARAKEIEMISAGKLESIAESSIPKMYCEKSLRQFDEKIRETIELCATHDPDGIIASLKGMMQRPDSCEFIASCNKPLLALMGDADNFISMQKIAEMKEKFSNVRFEILPETGHNSFIEKAEAAFDIVKDFTKENC